MEQHMNRLFVAFLALLIGCQSGPYTPKHTQWPDQILEDTEEVVLLDKPLVGSIRVDGVRSGRTSDDRVQVEARIRNKMKENLWIQVQTVFKDAENFSLGDETEWRSLVLNPNAMETYKALAVNPSSERFVIRIRVAR